VGLAILSGCAVSEAQGRVDPVGETPEPPPVLLPNANFARDAVLVYLSENERLDLTDLTWSERNVTQEGLVGGSTFEYTAGDWVVRVSFPVVNPADTVYTVTIANTATRYEWEGKVDATGQVKKKIDETAEWFDAVRARDAALAYLSERYSERAPRLDLNWNMTDATPGAPEKPLPGATNLRYEAGNWAITVDYPVVRPDLVEYEIVVVNETTGFRWAGKVTSSGEVTEKSSVGDSALAEKDTSAEKGASAGGDSPAGGYSPTREDVPVDNETLVPEPALARDAAMAYLDANYRGLVPVPMPDWFEENRTPEGVVGGSSLQYRGKEWIVAVSFPSGAPSPAVNPAATVYQVRIDNEANGFTWEGEVSATGEVTERMASGYTEPPAVGGDGWKRFFHKKFGYAFKYPSNCAIVSGNLDEALQVSTATTTDEGWPCLSVSHDDSDFYHPPAGTDLKQWILDWEIGHDEIETGLEIAGSPAVHLITKAAPGAYAYDEYYFVKGEQLFRILIVHCGNEDWDFYELFLSSFIFPGA
jgi:hypothetical protein